jgi:hypothetical protein
MKKTLAYYILNIGYIKSLLNYLLRKQDSIFGCETDKGKMFLKKKLMKN